jgi:hypothetical protein
MEGDTVTVAAPKKLSYYSYSRIDSYNATYNGIIGGRGLGKTFGCKRKVLRAAIKRGDQFILLRRYKEELSEARSTFFADIAHEFPDYDFRAHGKFAQMSPALKDGEQVKDKDREWQTIGYFLALSTGQRYKGSAFPRVTTIIFDEFLIEKGNIQYLRGEVTAFNNLYSTIDRWNDRTKVFFLANSVQIMNPYFIAWGILTDDVKEVPEFVVRKNGFIAFHFPDSEQFKSEVFETKFGQFIKDTEYADYAVGNEFSDNHGLLIGRKTSDAAYRFTLETGNGTYSVWADGNGYYIQGKRPKGQETLFTLLPQKVTEDKMLMVFSDTPLSILRTCWRQGKVVFDTPATRNTFAEIFTR